MDNNTIIYSLSDPRDNSVRYIGKTFESSYNVRYRNHIKNTQSKTHKSSWIRGLKSIGLLPIIEIIDVVKTDEWVFWEMHYISLYKSWGFNLTNHTIGGDGSIGITPWNKGLKTGYNSKQAESIKGKKHTEDTKLKMSITRKGKLKGRKFSENTLQKMKESAKKRIKNTPRDEFGKFIKNNNK